MTSMVLPKNLWPLSVFRKFLQLSEDSKLGPNYHRTSSNGEVIIEAKPDGTSHFSISGLEVRNLARYHNKVNGSCLAVTQTQSVKRDVQVWKDRSIYRGSICQISIPGIPETEPPTTWFEASITSMNLQDILKENTRLELGDSTRWKPEDLGRLIAEVVDPALRMVTQMDDVGRTNNNGYKSTLNQPFYDPVAAERERNQDFCYW